MVDLATVEALIGLAFAVIYVIANQDFALKQASKYIFLVCMVICLFQLWTEFTGNLELIILFWFSLVLAVVILIFDAIALLPYTLNVLNGMVKNWRGFRKR